MKLHDIWKGCHKSSLQIAERENHTKCIRVGRSVYYTVDPYIIDKSSYLKEN